MRKRIFLIRWINFTLSLVVLIIVTISCQNNSKKVELASEVITPVSAILTIEDTVFTAQNVQRILGFLASDSLKGRESGSKGLEKAAHFIKNELERYGIAPYKKSYLDTFLIEQDTTYNVLGFLKGSDPQLSEEIVIIGAHYDHIGKAKKVDNDSIANGANDNASGTTAVLLLANYFAKRKTNKRSILFALFSAEEKGLLGSKDLASKLEKSSEKVYFMLNFEMIGVPLINKSYEAYITGFNMSNMADKFNKYSAHERLIGYLPKAQEFGLFKRSDNFPVFEILKIPSQTISTFDFTNYDYYHHADDEITEINFDFMAKLMEKLVPSVETLISTPTREIQLNTSK